MAYSDFTIESAVRTLGLALGEPEDLFGGVAEVAVEPGFLASIGENASLARDINTEKARSELIIAPILLEVRRRLGRAIGFFSGIGFDVAADRGLTGTCDYLLSRSPGQLVLGAPVVAIVEAKNENIKAGLGQCIAEMVAARIFNERLDSGVGAVHGAVTTGMAWRFLRLDGSSVAVDRREYDLGRLGQILAILSHCVAGEDDHSEVPR